MILSFCCDTLGDVLSLLEDVDLCTAELLCKRIRRTIAIRNLWKHLFLIFCHRVQSPAWTPPSQEPDNWKHYYFSYKADLSFRCLIRHNAISQCFRWRVLELLPPGRDSLYFSVPSEEGTVRFATDEEETGLWWRVAMTINPTNHQFGIFLHQNRTADCYFTFTLTHPSSGDEVCPPLATRHRFPGEGQQSGWGWLFPLAQLEEKGIVVCRDGSNQKGLKELVINLELIQFPANDPASAVPRTQLLGCSTLSAHCRLHIAHSIHWLIHDDRSTKMILHAAHSSTEAFVDILEDFSSSQDLRLQVARIMWDILDVSDIRLPIDQIRRTITACCRSIHAALNGLDDDSRQVAIEVYLFLGVLMNLPVVPAFHERPPLGHLLTSQPDSLPLIFRVLEEPRLCNSHVICLQILTTLCAQSALPDAMIQSLAKAVVRFSRQSFPSVSVEFGNDMDITFSLRDIVDFFLPLLRCNVRCCIIFASLCLEEAYYGTRASWKAGHQFSIQAKVYDPMESG